MGQCRFVCVPVNQSVAFRPFWATHSVTRVSIRRVPVGNFHAVIISRFAHSRWAFVSVTLSGRLRVQP